MILQRSGKSRHFRIPTHFTTVALVVLALRSYYTLVSVVLLVLKRQTFSTDDNH